MNKKTSIIAAVILVGIAVIFGLILVNKGDGPVAGMIISDIAIDDTQSYRKCENSPGSGVYLVLSSELNKYTEKFKYKIPQGKDTYANIHLVECPKGAKFTGKWIENNKSIVKEETKTLTTEQQGIITFILDRNYARTGQYILELYNDENKKIFEQVITIE